MRNASDGDTVTLCSHIDIEGGIAIPSATEATAKTISLDLAGYGIRGFKKLTIITVQAYTTLNVYSTKPNAYLFVIDETNSSNGGAIFYVTKKCGKINFGTMLVGDVVYPGSNITTFSSSMINVQGEGTTGFYGDGGTHIANVHDWKGFICPRNGDGSIVIKNSNIILQENGYPIYSAEAGPTLYMENCVIIRADGQNKPLFHTSYAETTLKDCVTNYSLKSNVAVIPNTVTLLGNNIYSNALGIDTDMVKDSEGKVLARVNHKYSFVDGSDSVWSYDNAGRFELGKITIPEGLLVTSTLTDESNTIECTWRYDDKEETEIWHKDYIPEYPVSIQGETKEGLYRPGWYKIKEGDNVIYTGGLCLDFNIKVSVECEEYLCLNIYVPEYLVAEAYLDFTSITLNGESLGKSSWSYIEVNGEKYYKSSTISITEDPSALFTLVLVCEFENSTTVESAWQISLPKYIDKVFENHVEYTVEEIAFVEKIKNDYLSE